MKNQGSSIWLPMRAITRIEPDRQATLRLALAVLAASAIRHPGTTTLTTPNLHAGRRRPVPRAVGVVYEEKRRTRLVRTSMLLAEGLLTQRGSGLLPATTMTYGVLKNLGWDKDLTEPELATSTRSAATLPERRRDGGRSAGGHRGTLEKSVWNMATERRCVSWTRRSVRGASANPI